MTNKGNDGDSAPARQSETARSPDGRDDGRAPVSAVGAVIDLVNARTRRAFRKKEAEAKGNAKLGSRAPWRAGATAGAGSRGGAAPTPSAQASLGFKAARVLQIVVLVAGLLYLLKSCGYL